MGSKKKKKDNSWASGTFATDKSQIRDILHCPGRQKCQWPDYQHSYGILPRNVDYHHSKWTFTVTGYRYTRYEIKEGKKARAFTKGYALSAALITDMARRLPSGGSRVNLRTL